MDEKKYNNNIPQWKKDLMKLRDEYDNKKACEKKYQDTMKYTNQMLEECKASSLKRNTSGVGKRIAEEIDKMIYTNKCECKKQMEKTPIKNFSLPTENKQTSNFMNPFDNVDFSDYNTNNRFLIMVESGLFNAQPVNIRSFWQDGQYRIKMNMIEPVHQCLPMLLDTSIDNGVSYKITKTILKADGTTSYSVIYTGCKVIDYVESALDYNDINLRSFTITMDYKDYTYDV